MTFCWFTSYIGYPNFFKPEGRGADLARVFLRLGEAAIDGISYKDAKDLFPDIDKHQVETKKAAFQEFGLLYVVPRSDTITLTPLGHQILELSSTSNLSEENRRKIFLALTYGLSRYQFYNPFPTGGSSKSARERAASSDVLPYLTCYYLLHKLNGILTASEFRGAIFGIQHMSDLRAVEDAIRNKRSSGQPFEDLSCLPGNKRTADNLKIYFLSHVSLDMEIMRISERENPYEEEDQVFELTELGYEITETVLNKEWKNWRIKTSIIPTAKTYETIDDYFINGVGQSCSGEIIKKDIKKAYLKIKKASKGILDETDVETIKELPHREYKDGVTKLIQHTRLDRVRNPTLVKDAKRAFKIRNGRLFCEVCEFDFEAEYGERGKYYIEAHHKKPISELDKEVILRIEDLAMVCSNCHRMLHRPPWITIEALKEIIEEDRD